MMLRKTFRIVGLISLALVAAADVLRLVRPAWLSQVDPALLGVELLAVAATIGLAAVTWLRPWVFGLSLTAATCAVTMVWVWAVFLGLSHPEPLVAGDRWFFLHGVRAAMAVVALVALLVSVWIDDRRWDPIHQWVAP